MKQNANTDYTKTVTWNTKDLAVGAKLEGDYIDKEEFTYNGQAKIKYVIEGVDGTTYGVYGSAVLNRLFEKVSIGSRVWIEFKGKGATKNGNPLNLYEVEFDPEFNK